MRLTYNDIRYIVSEATIRLLNETISFPKEGYCLIIVGGPGVGKSYIRDNDLLINGKVFDIDEYREKYYNITKKKLNNKELALKLKKQEKLFLKNQNTIKNNIIFDICGRPEQRGKWSLIEEIVEMVKPMGYKIGVCWVVGNRSVAMQRNLQRNRTLPDKSFHQRHNQVLKFLPNFLTSERAKNIDDAWICFSTGFNLNDKNIPSQIKLQKRNNSFIIENELLNQILTLSGPLEKSNKWSTETYLSNSEIKKCVNNVDTYLRHPNITESILNESLSDILYHFTTIDGLYNMIVNNCFILSSSHGNVNDTYLNSGYPFYMSFTRERTSKTGYAAYMNRPKGLFGRKNDVPFSNQLTVRLEVDGTLLRSKFKGKPVDYHFKMNRNNKVQQKLSQAELVQYRQSEDRLLSTDEFIHDLRKYVRRIDIYYPKEYIGYQSATFAKLLNILTKSDFKELVNVYFNESDFNSNLTMLKRKNNNNEILNTYTLNRNLKKKLTPTILSDSQIELEASILACILYNESENTIDNAISYVLKKYGDIVGKTRYIYAFNHIKSKLLKNFKEIKNVKTNLSIYDYNFRGILRSIKSSTIKIFNIICNKYKLDASQLTFNDLKKYKISLA